MRLTIQEINQFYENLVLTKEEGLTIYILNRKVEQKEISRYFSYRDIEQAIKEATEFEVGPTPQTERVLKTLLHYFIEHPSNQRYKYMLTDYAVKFVKLIDNKLNSPFRKFPLRRTFQRYADFKAESIYDINDFKSWYEQGFHYTSQQTILDHLEALKDEVNSSIQQLNTILNEDFESAAEVADRFSMVFKGIGEKSEEIEDTLRLGNALLQEVNKVTDSFYKKVEEFKHPETETEQAEFDSLQSSYDAAVKIKSAVADFFQLVDERLEHLTGKALFASTQLKNLQDNFRNQSRIRINIKRLLEFTLNEASYSKDGPILPEAFPRKEIPHESFRFIEVPYYDSFGIRQNHIVPPHVDIEYAKREGLRVKKELFRQEQTAKLVRQYKGLLQEKKVLDFTKHFHQILTTENDPEIAMNVGFELFQYANSNPKYEIEIRKNFPTANETLQILTWKMKILQIQENHPSSS